MTPTVEKASPPSVGSTRASSHDTASESGLDPIEQEGLADGGLKKAILQHFVSLASTSVTHHGVPACWSAGEWNDRTWANGDMEASITQLFGSLGLDSTIPTMKHQSLAVFPGRRTNGFWLPVWKFRLDRDAKNGRLALSVALLCAAHVNTVPIVCIICCFAVPC